MSVHFGAFILTHGRPDNVPTFGTLRRRGYTGPIKLVIDNEDERAIEYFERFGKDDVIVFDKGEISKTVDAYDNFDSRRGVVYARNASFDIARGLGWTHFIQLDDDYTDFRWWFNSQLNIKRKGCMSLDGVFGAMTQFLIDTQIDTIAMLQRGDFIGGNGSTNLKSVNLGRSGVRKAMNTFVCATDRPLNFAGRINEDVNAYVGHGRTGRIFMSTNFLDVNQATTQASKGGMTELYLDNGTYVKSFYTVLANPSCVKVAPMGHVFPRLHHKVTWNNAVPKILRESVKEGASA